MLVSLIRIRNMLQANNDVKVGAWGGNGGTEWEYPFPENSILSKIRVVANKECVSSIQFTCWNQQQNKHVNSPIFGRDFEGCKPEIVRAPYNIYLFICIYT